MATNEDSMPDNYKPSLSTGVYGSYSIKPLFEYKASYSTGIYGSYVINNKLNNTTDTKEVTIKKYTYLPSISCGVFGVWLYNESSPYKMHAISPKQTSTKSKTKKYMKQSSGYGRWFRKKEQIDYKFEIRGARNETIQNGKLYNVKLLQEYHLPIGKSKTKKGTLFISQGSVVSFSGECIINAANEGMLGGGGVDGAISSAGGDALYYLRQLQPCVKGNKYIRCRTGNAVVTQSGYPYNKLQCDYVIHAVGPNYSVMYRGGKNMSINDIDKLLYASYAKSMLICKQKNIKTIGFCLISSGIFRGPRQLDDILRIGIQAIRDYMFENVQVFVIGYQNSELVCLSKVAPKVLGKMYKEYEKVKERKTWGWASWNRSNNNNDKDKEDSGFFNWSLRNKKKKNQKNQKKGGGGKEAHKQKNDT